MFFEGDLAEQGELLYLLGPLPHLPPLSLQLPDSLFPPLGSHCPKLLQISCLKYNILNKLTNIRRSM